MSSIFRKYSSLLKLPNISKWNTKNVANMNKCFHESLSLLVVPRLEK